MDASSIFTQYASIDIDGTICFDFSEIPAKYYTEFFQNFPKYALENVTALCLNCEKRRQFENDHPGQESYIYTKEISKSIAERKKDDYSKAIAEFLLAFFQKTKKLKSLTLSSLDLEHDSLICIIREIPKCQAIESIAFVDLSLQDDGVQELCKITKQGLKKINLIECDVTDKSIDHIKKYVHNNQVEIFQIKDANFSEASNIQLQQAVQKSKESFSQRSNNEDSDEEFDMEAIEKENKKLAARIISIREIVNPFEYSKDGVFVVGPGSKSFCNYLLTLTKKQDQLEQILQNTDE